MKVVILNYNIEAVEVIPLSEVTRDKLVKEETTIEDVLSNLGYNLSLIHWIVVDDNQIPVFYYGEERPQYIL